MGDYGLVLAAPAPASSSAPPAWRVVAPVVGVGAPALYGVSWSGRVGYVYGAGVIYSTLDGGASWFLNQLPTAAGRRSLEEGGAVAEAGASAVRGRLAHLLCSWTGRAC